MNDDSFEAGFPSGLGKSEALEDELFCNGPWNKVLNYGSAPAQTSTFNHPGGSVTDAKDMLRQLDEVMKQWEQPYRDFMLSKGFNPTYGDRMCLPIALHPGGWHPSYVHYSEYTQSVILIRGSLLDMYEMGR